MINGELFDLIDSDRGRITERLAKPILKQIVSALAFMHQNGIANRDIKLENVIVDQNFDLKMADFGFAKILEGPDKSGVLNTRLGTPGYMAPEILDRIGYSGEKTDTFALGVILFSMVTLTTPFEAIPQLSEGQLMIAIDRLYMRFCTEKDRFWASYEELSLTNEFKTLLDALLNCDPTLRPSTSEIISHPWFQYDCGTYDEVREELNIRKHLKLGVSIPTLDNRTTAQRTIARDGGKFGDNTYVLGPLTQSQIE